MRRGQSSRSKRQLLVVDVDKLIVLRMQKIMKDKYLVVPFLAGLAMMELGATGNFSVGVKLIEFLYRTALADEFILQHEIRTDDVVKIVEYPRQKTFRLSLEDRQGIAG